MARFRPSSGLLMHEFMTRLDRGGGGGALTTMHEAGLTLPQMIALHVLRSQPACTVNELALALDIPMSSASVLVQRLVDSKWASRQENPDDRREKHVAITKAGTTLITELERQRAMMLTQGLELLPVNLRNEFLAIVEKCLAALRATESKPSRKDSL